jgi:NuA3 HAT complex component NTO1
MKRTTDWRWVHVSCAMWVPEVFFRIGAGLEPIDLLQIPNHRWNLKCSYCQSRHGVAMVCNESKCQKKFHVTCGMQHDIFLQYTSSVKGKPDVIVGYCDAHADKWRKRAAEEARRRR